MNNEKKIEIPAMPEKYRLMPEMVNSASEKEAWTRLVTADEHMRRTRSQLRRLAKIAMGYITEGVRT
jgi:hypothetical protein|nr:MAG TPA_asm: hypothetical protein [Caudoviricetes sp.]